MRQFQAPAHRQVQYDHTPYDAGKKVLGRKRHIVVDTAGLLLGPVDAKIQAMTVRRFPLQSTASNDEKRLPSDDLPQRLRRNAGTGIGAPSVKSLGVNTP